MITLNQKLFSSDLRIMGCRYPDNPHPDCQTVLLKFKNGEAHLCQRRVASFFTLQDGQSMAAVSCGM